MRLHSMFPRHEPEFGRVLYRHPPKVLADQVEEPCPCRLTVRVDAVLLGDGLAVELLVQVGPIGDHLPALIFELRTADELTAKATHAAEATQAATPRSSRECALEKVFARLSGMMASEHDESTVMMSYMPAQPASCPGPVRLDRLLDLRPAKPTGPGTGWTGC